MIDSSYDCVVIGGGPAGSTVAAIVADAGYRTQLLEREKLPRYHIGESLMPETYWTLNRLGVLDQLRQSEFVKKLSVQFVSGNGRESQPFFFEQHDPRECSQTWQVERDAFDKLLFDNAAAKGADCRDGVRVLDVLFDGERATGVEIKTPEGTRRIAARVVVDATGQSALIANKLKLLQPIPHLRKCAIWTYYRGAERVPGPHGGATIILHTESRDAWFWYIPLSSDRTSIGLVGDVDYLLKRKGSPAEIFAEQLATCPALQRRLQDAERCEDFAVAKEFSFTTAQTAGPGWVLVGDAYGFIDPIYSSGVFFALKTGELAGDAIVDALRRNDLSGQALGTWAQPFKQGAQWVRRLVEAFYDKDFSMGEFMRQNPQHAANLTDILIGRVFHEQAGKMFADMPTPAGSSSVQ